MPRLGIKGLRRANIGLAALGVGAAIATAHPGQRMMDSSSEFLFGDAQVDRAIMGADVSPSELFNPIDIPRPLGAGVLGVGAGMAARGFGRGRLASTGIGLGVAAISGAVAMTPPAKYINPKMVTDAYGTQARDDYAPRAQITRTGSYSQPDYYTTQFPAMPTSRRRYTTGVDGSMVFGMHNLRMG